MENTVKKEVLHFNDQQIRQLIAKSLKDKNKHFTIRETIGGYVAIEDYRADTLTIRDFIQHPFLKGRPRVQLGAELDWDAPLSTLLYSLPKSLKTGNNKFNIKSYHNVIQTLIKLVPTAEEFPIFSLAMYKPSAWKR